MSTPVPQSSFVVGELSHRLRGRIDLDQYGLGLAKAKNFTILPQGPVRKRSGTGKIAETKFQPGSNKETVKWIVFKFNSAQSYVIEAGDLYLRFHTLRGQVFSAGVPYEIVSPYLASEVMALKYMQINDITYIVHGSHPVYKLTRISETNWTLLPVNYVDGPYLPTNITDTYLTLPSGFKPAGTGNPGPSFDGDVDSYGSFIGSAGTFSYTFNAALEYPVDGYSITFTGYLYASSFVDSAAEEPRAWTFQGQKAGSGTWITLDTRDNEADWIPGETRNYTFVNKQLVAYHSYRLVITKNNGGKYISIYEVALSVQNVSDTFTFSSIVGVNGGAGLTSGDVGRSVRLQGSDGRWRYINIVSVSNTTTFVGNFNGTWLQTINNIVNWRLGAFSAFTGYPETISIIEERIALASTKANPRTVWLSQTNDFENFIVNDPAVDTNPVTVEVTGEKLDKISWLNSGKGLFIGTSSLVTSIVASSDGPITYKNVRQVQQTNHGSSDNSPIRVGPVLLYHSTNLNCIRELVYNINDDAYDAPNLTFLNEHLYHGISRSVWVETPEDIILTPNDSGELIALAYERSQKVFGSTPYVTDGTFGLVAAIYNTTKMTTDVYCFVTRTINGVSKQFVEFFYEPFERQSINAAVFLDCSITYTGAATFTFSGLGYLEGKVVKVVGFAGAETSPKIYRRTVVSGSVTVDQALTGAYIGLEYEALLEILPARTPRHDGATSYKSRQKVDSVVVDLYRSAGLSVSGDGGATYEQLIPRLVDGRMDQASAILTGQANVPLDSSWSRDSVISIRSDDPLPAMIRLIMPDEDKE